MMKSARRCGAKHISKSKCAKHTRFGPLLKVQMSKKRTPLWREAHFEVKSAKKWRVRNTFGCSDFAWQAQGIVQLVKIWAKRDGSVAVSKNDGKRGKYAEDLARCISRGRRSARGMFIRAVRRSGRWFPERGCILEHQALRFAEMILHDRCSTSYDLALPFRSRRSTLDRWSGKIAKRIVTRPYFCTQLSIFEGSLAELLHFWCCQVQKLMKSRKIISFFWCCQLEKLRKSRGIAAFPSLQLGRQTDRQTNKQIDRQTDRQY